MVHTNTLLIDYCNQCTRDNYTSQMIITWLNQDFIHSFFNCGLLHTSRPAVGGNIKKTWGFCQFINFAGPPMFYCPHNLLILPVWGTPITVWRPVGTLNVKVWNHPPLRVHLTVIQTRLHTDWSGVVSSASGPNHPSEDLHSIGSNVPSSTDGLLPNHRTI